MILNLLTQRQILHMKDILYVLPHGHMSVHCAESRDTKFNSGAGQDMSEPFYQSSDIKCKNTVLSPRTLNDLNKTQARTRNMSVHYSQSRDKKDASMTK